MRYFAGVRPWLCLFVLACCGQVAAAGLTVTDAWIRAAPPGAQVMAGYATLANAGSAPITVLAVQSDAFRLAALHESTIEGGMAKMHELRRLRIAPGASVSLQPGGRHLMLMQPRHAIAVGDKLGVTFMLGDGSRQDTVFEVLAPDAPAAHDHE